MVNGCRKCDCTHLCFTPQLWDHFLTNLWNALRALGLALQRAPAGTHGAPAGSPAEGRDLADTPIEASLLTAAEGDAPPLALVGSAAEAAADVVKGGQRLAALALD